MSQSPGYQTAMAPRPLQNQAPQQPETGQQQQQPPAQQQQQQSRTSSITSIQLCQMATELISEIVSRTTERKRLFYNKRLTILNFSLHFLSNCPSSYRFKNGEARVDW